MKKQIIRCLSVALVGLAATASSFAANESPVRKIAVSAPATAATEPVEVAYLDLQRFDEVKRNPFNDTQWTQDLGEYVMDQAEAVLAPGQRLTVVFTNVALAGVYQPYLAGGISRVRVINDRTPPQLDLVFRLQDADGKVLSQGARSVRDAFFMRRRVRQTETLGYEKNLVDDFIRKEIVEPFSR